jgi:multiple sugar transport system substrate-binding protein
VLAAAALGPLAAALSACAGSSSLGRRSTSRLAVMNDNASWVEGFQAAGKAMNRIAGYDFDVNSIANNYNQIVKMSIQTQKIADVVKWQSGFPLTELVRGGRIAPLDDLWERAAGDDHVDTSLKPFVSVDSHVYGIPLYKSHFAFYYSKAAFEKYDLHPPDTYDDLIEIAEILKGNGVTPFSAQYSDWQSMCWFEELLTKTDPEFYQALTSGQASYTDPTVLDVLRRWSELMRKDWFTALDLDVGSGCGPMLKQGTLGMVPYGTWNCGTLVSNGAEPGRDFGLFNMPPITRGTPHTVIVESGVFTLPSESPNHAAALDVMDQWLAPRVQQPWSDYLQDGSANPNVPVRNPAVRELQEQLARTEAQPLQRFYESSPPQLVQTVLSDVSAFMLNPAGYREAAEQMARHADEAWTDWNLA